MFYPDCSVAEFTLSLYTIMRPAYYAVLSVRVYRCTNRCI